MALTLTVLYPSGPDATFDMDYYKNTHMPMLRNLLLEYGFKKYTIQKIMPGPDTLYSVQCLVEFEDAAKFGEGMKAVSQKLIDDIPNFSNKPSVSFVSMEVPQV